AAKMVRSCCPRRARSSITWATSSRSRRARILSRCAAAASRRTNHSATAATSSAAFKPQRSRSGQVREHLEGQKIATMITKHDILSRIGKHDGEWGWYQLERVINPDELPLGKTVMSLVSELEMDGQIVQLPAKPISKYKLTEKGKALLTKIAGNDRT